MQISFSHFKNLITSANSAINANNLHISVFENTVNAIAQYAITNKSYVNSTTKKQQITIDVCIFLYHNNQNEYEYKNKCKDY